MADEKDELEKEPSGQPSRGNGKDHEGEDIKMLALEEAAPADERAELEKLLEALRSEKDEIYDRLLRKQADFEKRRARVQ